MTIRDLDSNVISENGDPQKSQNIVMHNDEDFPGRKSGKPKHRKDNIKTSIEETTWYLT